MNNIFVAVLLGYLTDFFGIGTGALCAFLLCSLKKRYDFSDKTLKKNVLFSLAFEFSSGLMMAAVTFRLIPDAISDCGMTATLIGIFSGLLFVHFAQKLAGIKENRFKTSLILLINLWLHNIPEGFVLGSSVCVNINAAILFFLTVAVHNIPQGFLIALPASGGELKKQTVFKLICISGLPTALGAFLGAEFGNKMPYLTGVMLSFAAGSMLYTLIFELSYEARKMYGRKIIETAYIAGLILGITIF